MGRLLNIVTPLHQMTKRDYLARMVDDKVHCMLKAKEYEYDYWDGDRRYGYGGYRYIDDRWKRVAQPLIDIYGLKRDAKILDVGCGKAFLLYELQRLLPEAQIVGFDISRHGLADAKKEVRDHLFRYRAQDRYPFGDKHFDLVISRGDRTGGQKQIHHGRELPQRARAVQPGVLGADRGSLLRYGRMDLAV
jgi:SAM-dependent methyltransferase